MFERELGSLPPTPPRSPGLLPGLRFRALLPQAFALIPILMIVAFFLALAAFGPTDPATRLAREPTATATGRILSVTDNPPGCNRDAREILYVFTPASGPEHRGAYAVCPDSPYFDAHPGDPVQVRFLISDPAVSAIDDGRKAPSPPFFIFAIFPLFFLLIFSPFFVPQLWEFMRARRVVSRGQIARGMVVFARSRSFFIWPGIQNAGTTTVFVSFRTLDGAESEAEARCNNSWLVQHLAPGTEVHIAYLPDRPKPAVLLESYVR